MAIEQEMLNSSHDVAAGSQQQSGRLGWMLVAWLWGGIWIADMCMQHDTISLILRTM